MNELCRIQFCQVFPSFARLLQGAHIQCDSFQTSMLSCPCGSRPFRVVFNVQDLLTVSSGINSVGVHRFVLSKQIKLVEADATLRNHEDWDFLFCFNKGYDR